MHRPDLPFRVFLCALMAIAVFVLGYPVAFVTTHGFSVDGWPAGLAETGLRDPNWVNPIEWWRALADLKPLTPLKVYVRMISGDAPALKAGGLPWAMGLGGAIAAFCGVIVSGAQLVPRRDVRGSHGKAKWASDADLKSLRKGVEIGVDPKTRRPVRVAVEGNLVTIAPPRSGKTAGLVLPNLAIAEPGAFGGPVVVIDPKGEAYRAVRARREAMGNVVRCLDPLNLVGGADRWNPLLKREPNDTLYLLAMANALLPDTGQSSDASQFFRDRASVLVAAAMLVSIANGRNDPIAAAQLVQDDDNFRKALLGRTEQLARDALSTLEADERTRSSILATAAQAFQWALDERMGQVVRGHTFSLEDLARGDVDLFVVLPADERSVIIAPYVRWLLADLFSTIRKNRLAERILIMIDEAFVLGRFDAIVKGAGELPSYGASLWTFWQSRQQMIEAYGQAGADVLIDTAEVTLLFRLPRANPDEAEHWSKALGTYTGWVENTSPDPNTGRMTTSKQPGPIDLVPPGDMASVTRDHAIAFVNKAGVTSDPLRLGKSLAHRDPRFAGLISPVAPVGPTS